MISSRHLVNYSEKVLEGSLSILPRSGFVAALKSLLADDHDVVRRKALEVGYSLLIFSDQVDNIGRKLKKHHAYGRNCLKICLEEDFQVITGCPVCSETLRGWVGLDWNVRMFLQLLPY